LLPRMAGSRAETRATPVIGRCALRLRHSAFSTADEIVAKAVPSIKTDSETEH